MIAFAPGFGDHADFTPNALGIIGDSQDKRFTYVASLEPGYIIEIDNQKMAEFSERIMAEAMRPKWLKDLPPLIV